MRWLMDSRGRKANKLALLVGSNPLPNYLAAMALQPREVVLVYTAETKNAKGRLVDVLRKKGFTEDYIETKVIEDATKASAIQDACRDIDADHLHYTGGTKPMAVHLRMVFRGGDHRVSYLDERKALLRFEDGYDIPLERFNLELTLDVLLDLHAVERLPCPNRKPPAATGEALKALLQEREDDQPGDKKGEDGQDPGPLLEQWTAALIDSLLPEGDREICTNLHCKRNGVPFEIDVVVLRRHRLYVASCTAARRIDKCKSRSFEVAMRARQIGGDLARSALVCCLDGADSRGPYVDQLRCGIASIWDAPNTPRVFGRADLREWAGFGGEPNTRTLENWLNS
jgi:hypothetical protein